MRLNIAQDSTPVPDPLRLLLVEDERAVSKILGQYFDTRGFAVSVAREPEEALALLAHRTFDVLLTDLGLSRLRRSEGLEVLRYARYRTPGLRIVVLSGMLDDLTREACLDEGADEVLAKPQPLTRLEAVLRGDPG